jgi:hypothetical protein
LFTYYTDIYNKLRKDELDVKLFFDFLNVLKEIEDGTLDQHSGSFKVGTILKEMYVDSALKKAEKTEQKNPTVTFIIPEKHLSWKEFKKTKK